MNKVVKFRNAVIRWTLGDTFVSPEIQAERLSECNKCPHLKDERCSFCKCFVEVKSEMKTNFDLKTGKFVVTTCPDNRWKDIEQNVFDFFNNK